MTVIVWDGKALAADRQTTSGEIIGARTKIKRLTSGAIVATTGDTDRGLDLIEWYCNGAKREDWPKAQEGPDWAQLVVVENGEVRFFQQVPLGILCEEPYAAWGSGTPFALGALAMGANAVQAVEAASKHCSTCGGGVDYFEV